VQSNKEKINITGCDRDMIPQEFNLTEAMEWIRYNDDIDITEYRLEKTPTGKLNIYLHVIAPVNEWITVQRIGINGVSP
jgi:hypothetical protein